MKRLTTTIMALALMLGMVQCRKNVEQIAAGGQTTGETVYVTMTANCGGEKTDIATTGIVHWSADDRLYVVGSTQGCLGYLTPVNYTSASDVANFGGSITAVSGDTQTLHFYYFGKNTTLYNGTDNTYNYNIATQTGTLDGIENTMHLMHGSKDNVTAGTTAFGAITINNMMAIAKFAIGGYGSSAKCNAISTASLNLKTGVLTPGSAGTITLNGASDSYYMALIPSSATQTLTFTSSTGTDPVVLSRKIDAGKLYTQGGSAITVKPIPHELSVLWDYESYDLGYYTWEEAMTLTFPDGWRLPTVEECDELWNAYLDWYYDTYHILVTYRDGEFLLWRSGYNDGYADLDKPYCWTSTEYSSDEAYALTASYNHGIGIGVTNLNKGCTCPVHLVHPYSK